MFSYENLEVYKRAFEFNQGIYLLLKQNKNLPAFARNQLGRASLSIMLNIAEGSAKFSSRDRKNFFITARGSVFECSSMISFLVVQGEIEINIAELKVELEAISKMLFTMIRNLEK